MPGAGSASSFNVSPASTTNYTITVTDGCTTLPASAIITVTILPLPVIAFSPNVTSGCFPTCITFTDLTTVAGGSIASWNWDLGDGTTSVLQNPSTHCSYAAGTYDITLTATTTGGCSASSTINNMITIFPQPVAQFTFGPQPTTTETPTINFTDLSIDATNWLWDFGDATNLFQPNSSNQMNPIHMYGDTGQYCVTLIVQSIGGCPDTTINCLRIEPEYTFYIPNAFTPNGDEMNNVFAPKGQNIVEFTMRIFDRWGNMIFKSNSINDGWNGKVQNMGLVVQEDVYVYNIVIKDNLGKKHQYIGHVTVVK
jgi:gliding motility-associated-like protein